MEERPNVLDKDGSSHRFKRSELSHIADIIPEKHHEHVKLPIYIELVPDYGRGAAVIHGKHHCEIVQSILGIEIERKDEMIIYRLDIRRLRRVLPTTTQYAFYMSV